MLRPRSFLVLLLLIVFAGSGSWSTFAQVQEPPLGEQRYFPQSGHFVGGHFLVKYDLATDPEKVYGYPITEAFYDVKSEHLIQYFERALFILHPEGDSDHLVEVEDIGRLLYQAGDELPFTRLATCLAFRFDGVKKVVCATFREFFEAYGGVSQFGFPISNFEFHDNYFVQYFQKARFEWHPDNPPGERVVLTDLGRRFFDEMRENPVRLRAVNAITDSNRASLVLGLRVNANPAKPVLPLQGLQTVHIAVQDQNLQPVPDAKVEVEIILPSGQTFSTRDITLTDDDGLTQLTFEYTETKPGLVKMVVTAQALGYEKSTTTSFQVWW